MSFMEDLNHMTVEEKFYRFLPNTLYQSHYALAENYGHTPQEWRTFLRDNHLFIESELAAIAEAEARSALSRLGNASGQEVAALKAILEKSKLINDAQKQNTKIVLTFIPSHEKDLVPPSPSSPTKPKKEEQKREPTVQSRFYEPTKPVVPPVENQTRPLIPDEEEPKKERKFKYR